MYASYAANIDNKGEIITYGVNALGMYGNGAKVTNSGIITVTGTNAEAVIPRPMAIPTATTIRPLQKV